MFSFMKVYGYKIVVMHVNSILFLKPKQKSIHTLENFRKCCRRRKILRGSIADGKTAKCVK